MKLRYIYSACTVCETEDAKILSDPWFTPGAFYGSWQLYPPLKKKPIEVIGKVDAIYVSHLHPDHYDPIFLRTYLSVYPKTRVLIGQNKPAHLQRLMQQEGINPEVITTTKIKDIEISIFPNNSDSIHGIIDSAAVYKTKKFAIVNMNDNSFNSKQLKAIKESLKGQKINLAMLPYTGAMLYPQMYHFENKKELSIAIENQKKQGLLNYKNFIDYLEPNFALPFAGKYWLGGNLINKNFSRGVTDQLDAKYSAHEKSIVLEDGGFSYFDCEKLTANKERKSYYKQEKVINYLKSIPTELYPWEKELKIDNQRSLPLNYLLNKAISNAHSKIKIDEDIWICFKLKNLKQYLVFNAKENKPSKMLCGVENLSRREEIFIDDRLFFGILTRLYHWNNAYIGSHYEVKRSPDIYSRKIIDYLNYLHV